MLIFTDPLASVNAITFDHAIPTIPGAPDPRDPIYENGWVAGYHDDNPSRFADQPTPMDRLAWLAGYADGRRVRSEEREDVGQSLRAIEFSQLAQHSDSASWDAFDFDPEF